MDSQRAFVVRELLLALAGIGVGVLLLSSSTDPLTAWRVGVGAAAVAAGVLAVADRLRRRRALALLGVVGAAASGLLAITYPPDIAAVGAGIVGMNVGWALERLVFGVVRPVPAPRLARE